MQNKCLNLNKSIKSNIFLPTYTMLYIIVYLLLISPSVFCLSSHLLANETELIGQISAPHGSPLRNLNGLILSLDILHHNKSIHHSYNRISNSTFPLNYSIVLSDHDFSHENVDNFVLKSAILQPVYIHESEVHLTKNKITTHDVRMAAMSKDFFFFLEITFLFSRICYHSW